MRGTCRDSVGPTILGFSSVERDTDSIRGEPDQHGNNNGDEPNDREYTTLWRRYMESGKSKASLVNDRGSDTIEDLKEKVHVKTKSLCSSCRKIPFSECIPGLPYEKEVLSHNGDAIVFYISLSRILEHRWCNFCRLLLRCVSQPEYDLLAAEHIREPLKQSDKLRNIQSFPEWIERFPNWRQKWIDGADVWPFGYAIDRDEHRKSTKDQAKELFMKAEENDIKTTSLNSFEDMYQTINFAGQAQVVADKGIAIMKVAGNEKLKEVAAGLEIASNQIAMLGRMKGRRLPCIFMIRAYRRHEQKAGAVSVRVYGHGRAPLAPLREICHFSLRFDSAGYIRPFEQQIWYGNTLGPRIDIKFFAGCVQSCQTLHGQACEHYWSTSQREMDWYNDIPFRLIDVDKMCLIPTHFENFVKQDGLEYVALSYTWGHAPQHPKATELRNHNQDELQGDGSLNSSKFYIPQTIRDAIEVVRDLGQDHIRHLWVDKLCIKQEKENMDNEANIKRMGRIYNHAIFTIVAADSPHEHAGLKGVSTSRPPFSQITENGIVNENFSLSLPINMRPTFHPWDERVWCFQEKVLSRRLLVFAGGFAFWHCKGGVWREDVNSLDGTKNHVSFAWLRLVSRTESAEVIPWMKKRTGLSEASLHFRAQDQSTRLMRSPMMDRYVEAVEDLSKRSISNSFEILDAFAGLQNTFEVPQLLDSPFHCGLPRNLLDVALLWHSHRPLRRRKRTSKSQDAIYPKDIPSWTWAGWESAEYATRNQSHGGFIHYEKPFELHVDSRGIVKIINNTGEERIRPRKNTFYAVDKEKKVLSLGLFSVQQLENEGFEGWESCHRRPPIRVPLRNKPLFEILHDWHLIIHTGRAKVRVGKECWRQRVYTKQSGRECYRESLLDQTPNMDLLKAAGNDEIIKSTVSKEYWISIRNDTKAGVMKFDGNDQRFLNSQIIDAIVLSEAQYLGNEQTPDVQGYPLYNIMVVASRTLESGGVVWSRIGLGKVYKHAWRKADPKNDVVVLE